MGNEKTIPVHRMEDKFSGVYLAPFALEKSASPPYEAAQPHRHDFYYCVLIDRGRLDLEVDFKEVQLTDHSLFLSYPGQIHRIVAARPEQGWFLAFDPAMLTEPLRDILDECLSEVLMVPLAAEQSAGFFSFFEHFYTVYEDQAQLFRQPIIQALVTAFVYQLAAAYLPVERNNLMRHSARSLELTKAFKKMLRQNYKAIKRPSEFAANLNISVSYLNDTVRAVTGFPVTYYVQQEVMREAQRLLYQSDLSVQEIAYTLGFDDAQYFNRLFRKVVGISPGAFRKNKLLLNN